MIRLNINGSNGRMGTRLCKLAQEDSRFTVVACMDSKGATFGAEAIESSAFDAIIDVSSETGTRAATEMAIQHQSAILVGTTGLSGDSLSMLQDASQHVPVMIAPNMSVGIAVMKHISAQASALLGSAYDLSVVEFHHHQKKDSPSGTALHLVEAIEPQNTPEKNLKKIVGIRAGDIIGEHSVRFSGPGEYLEITHRATTRDLFVLGALRACAWLVEQQPGQYDIENALGLSTIKT